ncbi:MAG: peptidase S41 [Acidobacteria bacterium]|nr:peptidase S41 [Acidobacteriota bacterium]
MRFAALLLSLSAAGSPPLAEPAISPDRKEIAFVSGGDIWTVPAQGGEARLLISHAANDTRPLYSPDGKRLAFLSTRDGAANAYVLELSSGVITRLTHLDQTHSLDAWSRDGEWIYISTAHAEVGGLLDIYRVRSSGGTPMPVSADRYASEFHAAPTPDGKRLLFVARGLGMTQWWRKGRSHIDESEIWILDEAAAEKDKQLLGRGAKQLWPQWMPDGQSFYFVSDRGGAQNLHLYTMGKGERAVTKFSDGRVLYPSLSADGKLIVFERDFGIWKLDTASGKSERIPIIQRGAPATPRATEFQRAAQGFSQLALSPDGKKIAFNYWGEIWATSAKEGGEAFRVTANIDGDGDPVWSPDSNQLAYTASGDGVSHIAIYDFRSKQSRTLTSGAATFVRPAWSPDGKKLAYVKGGEELFVHALDGSATSIYKGKIRRDGAVWSPDGEWLGAMLTDERGFVNAHVIKADGSIQHQVSWLPNTQGGGLVWLPDGSGLIFTTNQRTEPIRIASVSFKPRAPEFREAKFLALFEQKEVKPSNKTEIVLDGLRERVRITPLDVSAFGATLSRDGKQLAFVADLAGASAILLLPTEATARPRTLLTGPGRKSSLRWDADNKTIYFLQDGRVSSIAIDQPQPKSINVLAELETRFEDTKRAMFRDAWMTIRDRFYDPAFHGADWNGEVKRTYGEQIGRARTTDEVRRLLNLMVGELNASHLGASAAPSGDTGTVGRLGIDWDVNAYEKEGKWRVAHILPRGPAALAGIPVGAVITAVNGEKLDGATSLDRLLARRVGKETMLDAFRVLPITTVAERALRYSQWVNERKAFVDKWSGGKLGYVHIMDMGSDSLTRLELDLDAVAQGKQGVVVDIRNNNGGFVNGYALDILTRRNYMNMQMRDGPNVTARAALGQRAIGKPTILITNQHTLSDGEDFTEGYRALGLGKVVGEPTAGWIIYTSNDQLIDGTMFRVPGTKVTTTSGVNMERNPRSVDIRVDRPMGESYRGADIQLETAVKTLLSQL